MKKVTLSLEDLDVVRKKSINKTWKEILLTGLEEETRRKKEDLKKELELLDSQK